MPLFIIDFDETIASKNTHNAASKVTSGGMDAVWAIIKDIPPIGTAEIWRTTIRSILDQGHRLAIASFNAYGVPVIPKYLEEVIGLHPDEIKNIHVQSWLPINPQIADKNEHIKYAIADMGYFGSPDSIVVVDDDLKNILAAQKKGYRTIHATGDFTKKIQRLSDDWNHSISTSKFFKKTRSDNKDGNHDDEPSSCILS